MDGDDGDDALYGGPGDDDIWNIGSGADRLYGGDGDDHLWLYEQSDGAEDYLYCGEGHDAYYLPDPQDASVHVSESCEVQLTHEVAHIPPPWEILY